MKFKPMLAVGIDDVNKLRYPLYASPKLDGIRAMVQDGKLVSRNLKPIQNQAIQRAMKDMPEGLDGELIYGEPTAKNAFRITTSKVMSRDEDADNLVFYAFDIYGTAQFQERYRELQKLRFTDNFDVLEQKLIRNADELLEYETEMLEAGYEGLITRSIDGPYKEGRSTLSQGYLLKLKRFLDSEAVILDSVELQHNNNVATTNALGRTERSSHKANMVGGGVLGKFCVRDLKTNVEFEVGSGYDDAERETFWKNRKKMVGQILKYQYFPVGVKDKPRFPTFLGIRDKRDM